MIYQAAFWLAIVPPVLAVLIEYFNPINAKRVRADAELDLQADFGNLADPDRQELLQILEQSGAAVAEVSGLIPTLIAATASGLAVIHELQSPFWPIVFYVLSFFTLGLCVWWLLSGLTFAKIGALNAAIPVPFTGREKSIPVKRITVVSFTIYLGNILLITLAVIVFWGKEEPRDHPLNLSLAGPSTVERAKELQDAILEHWAEKTIFELRLDNLQDQITYPKDEIAKLNEWTNPSDPPPASEAVLGSPGWRRIQVALCRSGFDPGPVDGNPGPKTRETIRQFQRAEGNGTKASGHLTPSQIEKLWSIPPPTPAAPKCV